MSHRLISAAAARLGVAPVASTAPAPLVVPPAAPPAAQVDPAAEVDVITVADAQAAVAAAETRGLAAGAVAERARASAVHASDAGKANPTMANWMLDNNPTASADAIVTALAAMPAAPAPAAAAAPAAPAAITTPLTQTPKVEVAPQANGGQDGAMSQDEINKMWDQGIQTAAASSSNNFGADIAPGLPRTGN